MCQLRTLFRAGESSGPTQTHGEQMPGLAKLKTANPDDLRIHYRALAKLVALERVGNCATAAARDTLRSSREMRL